MVVKQQQENLETRIRDTIETIKEAVRDEVSHKGELPGQVPGLQYEGERGRVWSPPSEISAWS